MARGLFSSLYYVPKTGRTDPMIDLSGDRELIRALQTLAATAGSGKPVNRVIRSAIGKGARIYIKEAKRQVKASGAYQSGTLYKSLGHRMYTTLFGEIGAVIGPRTGHARRVSVTRRRAGGPTKMKASKRKGRVKALKASGVANTELRNPTRYAHLVERGTAKMPPRPFMRRAFDAQKSYVTDMTWAWIVEGIQREARKLAAKQRRAK